MVFQHTFDVLGGQELLQVVPVVDILATSVLDLTNTHDRLSGLVPSLSYKKVSSKMEPLAFTWINLLKAAKSGT